VNPLCATCSVFAVFLFVIWSRNGITHRDLQKKAASLRLATRLANQKKKHEGEEKLRLARKETQQQHKRALAAKQLEEKE
jgi:hypothetical protein